MCYRNSNRIDSSVRNFSHGHCEHHIEVHISDKIHIEELTYRKAWKKIKWKEKASFLLLLLPAYVGPKSVT